jgi:hypothetical protein
MNKKLLLASALLCTSGLTKAHVYLADTAFTTDIGFSGAKASCVATASKNGTYGINQNRDLFFQVAEDFTVPTGQTWNLDTVIVYAYQTGSGVTPSITAGYLTIYQSSIPGTIIFGDSSTTDRLVSKKFSGIYRVDNVAANGALTSTQRPIMELKLKVTPTKALTAGTYWIAWSAKGNSSYTGPWCPPKVSPGRIAPSGQNGKQRTAGTWITSTDSISTTATVNNGFNFILKGPQKPASGVGASTLDASVMEQNQPNPFTGVTTINYNLPEAGQVKLDVINSVGQRVATLLEGQVNAGKGSVTFNAQGMAAGKYYYRLQTEGGTLTKSMEILK